jgi:hypothetical protein
METEGGALSTTAVTRRSAMPANIWARRSVDVLGEIVAGGRYDDVDDRLAMELFGRWCSRSRRAPPVMR